MGQKTNPIGNRLGIIRGWESNWYGGNDYGDKIAEDDKIRKYVNARLFKASVSRVIIERTLKLVTVTITTARPGIIIGKGGQEVDNGVKDKSLIYDTFDYAFNNDPGSFKMAIQATMRMNAEGIKIQISGRLNGAEMARSEHFKEGRIPLSTFRADIDHLHL